MEAMRSHLLAARVLDQRARTGALGPAGPIGMYSEGVLNEPIP